MGAYQSGRSVGKKVSSEEVNFDHFQILRAIGRGSFGKVCIVQKKDTKKLYAMKYMNKRQCAGRDALLNVLREVEILRSLEHPFLVNLWFSFQDEEDLFLVSDLLLGGDLRYHVTRGAAIDADCVLLYVCELAAALDFLQSKRILHRDIKPDNILLDEEGHVHLTDFNIAIILEEGQLATSMSGTKPYMAPEIFACADNECAGYGFPVDWWSLGVCAFEMLTGNRPFDIHSATSISDVRCLFNVGVQYPSFLSRSIKELLSKLLNNQPGARISSFYELKKMQCFNSFDFETVLQKKTKPSFIPPKNHLNCDPTYELEEMIIEAKPLHKKKKRLAKQRSLREMQGSLNMEMNMGLSSDSLLQLPNFKPYNRELETVERERESKERCWEEELRQSMEASNPVESLKSSKSEVKVEPASGLQNSEVQLATTMTPNRSKIAQVPSMSLSPKQDSFRRRDNIVS